VNSAFRQRSRKAFTPPHWRHTALFHITVLTLAEENEMPQLVEYCTKKFRESAHRFFRIHSEDTVVAQLQECYAIPLFEGNNSQREN
jgi:hypothetical protein